MSRMIVLAGAPEPAKLDWNEKSLLPEVTTELITELTPSNSNISSDSPFKAQWRQISTERLQMRTTLPKLSIAPLTQIHPEPADFFSPSDHIAPESPSAVSDISGNESQPSGTDSAESTNEALADYYDHSFTIYEAVPSSQVTDHSYTPGTPTYESTSLEFPDSGNESASTRSIIRTPSQRRLSQAPKPKLLTNLSDIPNAAYLLKIQPQTKTVNLIVGIISISPTRKVTTGKAYNKPRQLELIELTVADETKRDFVITMWLPKELHVGWRDRERADSPSGVPDACRSALRRQLKSLRTRDVVLLQNVALTTYKGKVAGASLKGEVTKVDLLHRRVDDAAREEEGVYSKSNLRNPVDAQIRKVKGVRDWVVENVPEEGTGGLGVGKRKGKGGRRLPEESQLQP